MHAPFPENQHAKRPLREETSPLKGAWFGGCQPAKRRPKRYSDECHPQSPSCRRPSPRCVPQCDGQLGLLGLNTAIPEGVRALAEKTVAQTCQVYDRSSDAFDASVATFEKTFDAAGQSAAAFNRKIIDISRRNLNSVFDLATSLAGAKDLADIVELQRAHWQKQWGTLTSQAEEVRALATKVAAAAGEPLKEQVKRGVDQLRKAN